MARNVLKKLSERFLKSSLARKCQLKHARTCLKHKVFCDGGTMERKKSKLRAALMGIQLED